MCLQTRFSMELAALGTPGVPLNKTRVPRQAATAAKAAIKKDLLMQNSRPGASSVPPKGTSLPATKPATVTATKPTASKLQKVPQFARLQMQHVQTMAHMSVFCHYKCSLRSNFAATCGHHWLCKYMGSWLSYYAVSHSMQPGS